MFVRWSDAERRQIMLAVAEGRMDHRMAEALLNKGYLDLVLDPGEAIDEELFSRYRNACSLYSIPAVACVRKRFRGEKVRSLLGEKPHGGSVYLLTGEELLSDRDGDRLTACLNQCEGYPMYREARAQVVWGFPSEGQAEKFAQELVKILASRVSR